MIGGSGASDRIGVVVVAAGSGVRFGADGPKALVELAGRPLVAHALTGLAAAGLPPAVLVRPPDQAEAFALAAGETPVAASVAGGDTRTASVAAGVAALAAEVEVVVVHDAARPLTPPAVIAAAVAAVVGQEDVLAAAPGVPVADTLKRTRGREVVETVDRTDLVGVQTPQVFPRAVLERALASGAHASDDLGLVEELRSRGHLTGRIVLTEGSVWSRKVTYPGDLALLEVLAAHAAPGTLDATGRT